MDVQKIFICCDIIIVGTLNLSICRSFSVQNLANIYKYVKRKQNTSMINFALWKHVICSKMLLKEPIAKLFFETSCLLSGVKFSFDTLVNIKVLLMLLYINNLKSSTSCLNRSLYEEVATSTSRLAEEKSSEELNFMYSVLRSLEELLSLMECGSSKPEFVSVDTIFCLDFLFESYNSQTIIKFSDLIRANISCIGDKYVIQNVIYFIRCNLERNPYGVSECLRSGLCVKFKCNRVIPCSEDIKNMHAITNSKIAPACRKVVALYKLNKQALAISCTLIEHSLVYISNCKNVTIYLLSPLRTVVIENCKNSTFVLGSVCKSVTVLSCSKVNVHVISSRTVIEKCVDSVFFLHTPFRPLLVGQANTNIQLAPFNTFYHDLPSHMRECHLSVQPNNWNDPLCISNDLFLGNPPPNQLLPISQFTLLDLSLHGEKSINGTCIPGLPESFLKHVSEEISAVKLWETVKSKKSASLCEEMQELYNYNIKKKFELWLIEKGYKQELSAWQKSMKCITNDEVNEDFHQA